MELLLQMCDKLFEKTCNVRSLEYIMQMYFSEIRNFKQIFNSDPYDVHFVF